MECPRCKSLMPQIQYGDDEGKYICINQSCGLELTIEEVWSLYEDAVSLIREWPLGHPARNEVRRIYGRYCELVDGHVTTP